MKMLIIARNREYPLVEQTPELMKETAAYLEKIEAEGKLEIGYLFANGGGFMVGDFDTAEEVWAHLHGYPNYGTFNWTVEPAVETDFVMKAAEGG